MSTLFFFNNSFQDSFEINYDVFDTNLINLSIVLALVINVLGDGMNLVLDARKERIVRNLQNSNNKVVVVKEKLKFVKSKLDQVQIEMKKVYESRFSIFVNRKQRNLGQIKTYLDQLEILRNDIIEARTQRVLDDVYGQTISITFDKLYQNILFAFKQTNYFSNKQKITTYNYVERFNSN